MNSEQCKNCPLVEELKLLQEKIKIMEEKLEKYERPAKHAGNSSMPSSSDKNNKHYPQREKTGRRRGGQIKHKGHSKALFENPDEIVELYPHKCTNCGNDHFIQKDNILERRQVADVPEIKPFVTEYQKKAGICSKCGNRNTGEFPKDIAPNIQIGEKTKGLIGYFNVLHNISYERVTKIFEDIFSLKISKGTVDNKLKELSKELKPGYDKILDNIKESDVIGSDESGIRINGNNAFIWTFQNEDYTYYTSSSSRGFQVVEQTIGNSFSGSWVSDRLGSQLKIKANHQFCLVHLIRECKYIIEAENSEWAKNLKDFFERTIEFKKKLGKRYDPLDKEIFREIFRYKQEIDEIFLKPPPKKLENRLFRSLVGNQERLILFLSKPEVPYDNNASERALRNRVIHHKVSGGFRSFEGAFCHDIIASVIETTKKQGKNILDTISMLSKKNQDLLQA